MDGTPPASGMGRSIGGGMEETDPVTERVTMDNTRVVSFMLECDWEDNGTAGCWDGGKGRKGSNERRIMQKALAGKLMTPL
jgi:hypothetical protein